VVSLFENNFIQDSEIDGEDSVKGEEDDSFLK
jgi:hypothetical protein